jgi:hypothetical protein
VPGLDAATEGQVEQALRLVVMPDLPETAENETSVTPFVVKPYETEAVPAWCSGGCDLRLAPGEAVRIAVVAGTTADDAIVDLVGLEVTVEGSCP